jgi:hypothetical protein
MRPMADFWDTPEGKLGKDGELAVLSWRRKSNTYVMPASEYSGKDDTRAPMICTLKERVILPDFLCAKNGRTWWDEAKAKSKALSWRNHGGKKYHGIEKRQYHHYRAIRRITGLPVGLIIYEKDTGTLLYLKDFLDRRPADLGCVRIRNGKSSGTHMVNWARDDFRIISSSGSKNK